VYLNLLQFMVIWLHKAPLYTTPIHGHHANPMFVNYKRCIADTYYSQLILLVELSFI
jgi:hypothetical protein